MPLPVPFRRVLVTLSLCVAGLLASAVPARAAAPASVRVVDARIAQAQHRVDHWNHVLLRWQVRVGRAAGRLQRVSLLPRTGGVRVQDYLTPRMAHHAVHFPPTPRQRLMRAHRRLQGVLRDHRALEAQQQLQAWSGYMVQLEDARRTAMRAARHGALALPDGPVTYEGWARAFLASVGAPDCGDNVVLTVAWETAESTAALYNPLATTHDMPGAGVFNGSGVRNYASLTQGIEASRDTLQGGADSYGYGAILTALLGCASAETTAATIRDSAWCRGCAAGAYVLGLLPTVRATWAEHAARLISTPS